LDSCVALILLDIPGHGSNLVKFRHDMYSRNSEVSFSELPETTPLQAGG